MEGFEKQVNNQLILIDHLLGAMNVSSPLCVFEFSCYCYCYCYCPHHLVAEDTGKQGG